LDSGRHRDKDRELETRKKNKGKERERDGGNDGAERTYIGKSHETYNFL
jgi:hypothetical protein